MCTTLNNQQNSSNSITNFTINNVIKSESDNQDSPERLVIFSNCNVKGSNELVGAMTAIYLEDQSTFFAPPSAIRTNAEISDDDRNSIEIAVSQNAVEFLNSLKEASEYDPKLINTVNHYDFVDMLSECC
jgi:hypothetical protein